MKISVQRWMLTRFVNICLCRHGLVTQPTLSLTPLAIVEQVILSLYKGNMICELNHGHFQILPAYLRRAAWRFVFTEALSLALTGVAVTGSHS